MGADVHLTDDVRRYAIALLGNAAVARDDATESAPPMASELPRMRLERLKLIDADADAVATDYVAADKKRAHVIERFASHLEFNDSSYKRAKSVELPESLKSRGVTFDFVIERPSERQIVLVRRELSDHVRVRLVRLLHRLGPEYIGVRVWPIGAEKAWFWEKEWISPGDSPPEAHNAAAKTPPMSDSQADVSRHTLQPRPTVQREFF